MEIEPDAGITIKQALATVTICLFRSAIRSVVMQPKYSPVHTSSAWLGEDELKAGVYAQNVQHVIDPAHRSSKLITQT